MGVEVNGNEAAAGVVAGAAVVGAALKIRKMLNNKKSEVDQSSKYVKCKLSDAPWEAPNNNINILIESLNSARPKGVFTQHKTIRAVCKKIVDILEEIKKSGYEFETFKEGISAINDLKKKKEKEEILNLFYSDFHYMILANFTTFQALYGYIKIRLNNPEVNEKVKKLQQAEQSHKYATVEFEKTVGEYKQKLLDVQRVNLIQENGSLCGSDGQVIKCNNKELKDYKKLSSQNMVLNFKKNFILFAILTAYVVVTYAIRNDWAYLNLIGSLSFLPLRGRNKMFPKIMNGAYENKSTLQDRSNNIQNIYLDELAHIRNFSLRFKVKNSASKNLEQTQNKAQSSKHVSEFMDPESKYILAAWRFLRYIIKNCPNCRQILKVDINDNSTSNNINSLLKGLNDSKLGTFAWIKKYVLDSSYKKYLHEQRLNGQINDFRKKLVENFNKLVKDKISELDWKKLQEIFDGKLSGDDLLSELKQLKEKVISCYENVKEQSVAWNTAQTELNSTTKAIGVTPKQKEICELIKSNKYLFSKSEKYKKIFNKMCHTEKLDKTIESLETNWEHIQSELQKIGMASEEKQEEFNRTNVPTGGGTNSKAQKTKKFTGAIDGDYKQSITDFIENVEEAPDACENKIKDICKKSYESLEDKIVTNASGEILLSGVLCKMLAVLSVYRLALNLYREAFIVYFNHKCRELVKSSAPSEFAKNPSGTSGAGGRIVPQKNIALNVNDFRRGM